MSADVPIESCAVIASTYGTALVGRESTREHPDADLAVPPSRDNTPVLMDEPAESSGEKFGEYCAKLSFLCPDPPSKYES